MTGSDMFVRGKKNEKESQRKVEKKLSRDIIEQKRFIKFLLNQKLLILIVLLVAAMAIKDTNFFSLSGVYEIFDHIAIIGIMAVGMTVLLISGSFDLSIGSVLSLTTVIVMLFQERGILISIIMGVVSGIAVGILNGLIVVKGKINPFIATLGSMLIAKGFALGISRSQTIVGSRAEFIFLAHGKVLGIPNPFILLVIFLLIGWYILRFTKLGRNSYAIGGNEHSAILAGIQVNRSKFVFFVFCSLTASISGLILASKTNTGNAILGDNVVLIVIGGVVLGGTSLFGGRGHIMGTIQGVLVLGLIERAMVVFHISSWYQYMLRGIVILAVIVLDTVIERRRREML